MTEQLSSAHTEENSFTALLGKEGATAGSAVLSHSVISDSL